MAAGLLAATATQRPQTGRLEGIALSYGITAQLDGFSEEFAAGAFRNLDDPAILLVAEHNPERLLARTGAGTLRFEDSPPTCAIRPASRPPKKAAPPTPSPPAPITQA